MSPRALPGAGPPSLGAGPPLLAGGAGEVLYQRGRGGPLSASGLPGSSVRRNLSIGLGMAGGHHALAVHDIDCALQSADLPRMLLAPYLAQRHALIQPTNRLSLAACAPRLRARRGGGQRGVARGRVGAAGPRLARLLPLLLPG